VDDLSFDLNAGKHWINRSFGVRSDEFGDKTKDKNIYYQS
jgi:hypothetical protein